MSVTSPRRANLSAHNTPSKSPSRRVLGDLTPRAINTPSKQAHVLDPSEVMRAHSPLKQMHTLSPQVWMEKENTSQHSALKAGKKRGIDQVEGAENMERASKMFSGRDGAYGRTDTLMRTGLSGVLDECNIIDGRGSSTEPDTPTREQENQLDNSQQSNQSFSNFVNWKECDTQSQQQSQSQLQPIEEQPQPPTPPESEKKKSTKLDRLRLGLGLAMYKVKTNQVNKSGLEILSRWETLSASNSVNAPTSTATATASATSSQSIPSITLSAAQQATHVVANLDPGRPIPKLLGGPQLLPTAISSRMIYDYHMPSSPPDATVPTCVSPEQVMSSMNSNYYTPPARRIKEDDYEDGEEDDVEELSVEERFRKRREKLHSTDLTSSVVKGNAAKGLLELRAQR